MIFLNDLRHMSIRSIIILLDTYTIATIITSTSATTMSLRQKGSCNLLEDIELPDFIKEAFPENQSFKRERINNSSLTYFKQPLNKGDSDESMQVESCSNEKKMPCKVSKNKIYAKNYRQKRKEQMKFLEEENKFLKKKVEDLSFRLREAELQICQLKNQENTQSLSFKQAKQKYFKRIEELLPQAETNKEELEYLHMQINNLITFNGSERIDLLNYYMGELLHNLVNDSSFYYIDCIVNKKGQYRTNKSQPLRLIDVQVHEILGIEDQEKQQLLKNMMPEHLKRSIIRFQEIWKEIYKNYVKILNEGAMIENLYRQVEHIISPFVSRQKFIELEIFFQKNKYRKDVHMLRNSWLNVDPEQIIEIQKPIEKKPKFLEGF